MPRVHDEDLPFRVLHLLQNKPDLSQRQIASELDKSLGGVNYCLRALIQQGQVKVRNFRCSNNKLRYAYVLTPKGLSSKTTLTVGFLRRKMAEYEALKVEIENLKIETESEIKKLNSEKEQKQVKRVE